MPKPDFIPRLLNAYQNVFHGLLESKEPLSSTVLMWTEKQKNLLMFRSEEAATPEVQLSPDHLRAVLAELAKPHTEDEVLVFDVRDVGVRGEWLSRARIEREVPPPKLLDTRNHLPFPMPTGWHGPYEIHLKGVYRIDTPDCSVLARIDDEGWDYSQIDDEGSPRHFYRLELGVTRALDSKLASDEEIAEVTKRFRFCGPWSDVTRDYARRHPSRRIFHAEVTSHPQGTPWPELQQLPEMLGPPPGWEPVTSFHARPLVFQIEGTELQVEWAPAEGVDLMEAAKGRAMKASRFAIRANGRRATDAEVGTVSAMLGGATFEEEKRGDGISSGGEDARVFRATAGWLRKTPGRG